MTEARLSRSVQDALRQHGAFVFKVHGSEYMIAGLPDLIVCYQGQFFGLELKLPGNKTSPRQEYIGEKIQLAGGQWAIVHSVAEALSIVLPDFPAERPSHIRQ
jgi:hypothetical protein